MSRLFDASLMFPLQDKKNTGSSQSLQLFLYPTHDLLYMYVGMCVEALYLRTLNLGKWIEFLMNTVKLMASTNAGSL